LLKINSKLQKMGILYMSTIFKTREMRLNSMLLTPSRRVLIKTAISLMSISVAFPALADTRSEVIAALQNKTNIPVEFPGKLPDTDEKIYLNGSADNNSYTINFDYTQDCSGSTACSMGYFTATKGAQIQSKSDYSGNDEYQYIKLNNGYNAVFINTCGAYCMALIEWKVNGVVYSVYLKNGTKEEAMKIANSVYN
jgi:hypothetical protein